MEVLIVLAVVIAAVVVFLWYVWGHKAGALGRGIDAAGSRYNEFYGLGSPPQPSALAGQTPGKRSDPNTSL